MRIASAIILILFLRSFAFAQSTSNDVLLNDLQNAKEDSIRARILTEITDKYVFTDPDRALYYNNRCEELLQGGNLTKYQHQCYHNFVRIYHTKRDFKTALEYCLKALDVARHTGNRFQEATSLRALFNVYHNLHLNDSAVKYAVQSIQLTQAISDTTNLATNFGNLTWLYKDLTQYEKAIEYGLKGIEAGVLYGDSIGLLVSLNNTAICYLKINKDREAIELLKRQYEIGTLIKRHRSIRNALINLGEAYFNISDAAALAETTKLLNDILDSESSLTGQVKCLQFINNAYNFALQKKFGESEAQIINAMRVAKADSLPDLLASSFALMSRLKFAQHDFAASNYYHTKLDSLNEHYEDLKLSQYAAELETKYELEKKTTQIRLQEDELRHRTIANYMLTGAGFSFLIISLLTYRTFSQKQKLQQQRISELEKEKQLSATEAVLKGEEQERTRLARDLHDGLGGMLSGIKYSFNTIKENLIMTPENHQAFERSMDMLDSSIKEMRRVAHNMMPESLIRFGLDSALKDFCSDITESGALSVNYQSFGVSNSGLDQTISITVYRIIQELINNTIKHAKAQNAIVQLEQADGKLTITVEDDGVGFDANNLQRSRGAGWNNIQSRVAFLRGLLEVRSDKTNGTSVRIEVEI